MVRRRRPWLTPAQKAELGPTTAEEGSGGAHARGSRLGRGMARSLTGRRGARGKQGRQGNPGAKGAAGARGLIGPRGPAGPAVSKAQMLEAVAGQFAQVNQRLEVQLTRIAQLQQQMDQQHKDIVETRADLTRIRGIIENIVKSPA